MESNCESAHRPGPQLWCQQCFSSLQSYMKNQDMSQRCMCDSGCSFSAPTVRRGSWCIVTDSPQSSWVNMQAYKDICSSALYIKRNITCFGTLDLKQNWRVRCLLITVNPTGAAVFSSCRGSHKTCTSMPTDPDLNIPKQNQTLVINASSMLANIFPIRSSS